MSLSPYCTVTGSHLDISMRRINAAKHRLELLGDVDPLVELRFKFLFGAQVGERRGFLVDGEIMLGFVSSAAREPMCQLDSSGLRLNTHVLISRSESSICCSTRESVDMTAIVPLSASVTSSSSADGSATL